MAKIISVGNQKGGCGKSTTSSIISYLLSKNKKVLAVDMDGQGNFTQLLTGIDDIFEFGDRTIHGAILNEDARPYISVINENLHIIAGDEKINTFGSHFHVKLPKMKKRYTDALKNALSFVSDLYDYIIIDTPPALGEISFCALSASDYVVIMFETSKFCYSSLLSYLETIEFVQKNINPTLKIAGILRTMIDNRRSDNKYYSELIENEFKDLCFNTIIQRTAVVGRLPSLGLFENNEIKKIIGQYNPFFKELIKVV